MTQPIKVNAVWLVQEGVYLVTLPHHGSRTYYVVADIKVTTNTVTVKSLDEISAYTTIDGGISHYLNKNDERLSVEEYNESLTELESKGYLDDYDDIVFGDIDDEYEYKKFISRWRAVYNPPPVRPLPLEFVVTEIRTNSGDPDIISLWNSPTVNNKLYSFDRHRFSLKYFQFLCERKEFVNTVPSHGGLRYAQINNKYIFDSTFDWSKHPAYIGTLEQCKQEKQKILEAIERTINIHTKSKDAELVDAAGVLEALYKIRGYVCNVTPISKTRTSYSLLINSINSLITMIEDDVVNN